jgi:hypothetical protein
MLLDRSFFYGFKTHGANVLWVAVWHLDGSENWSFWPRIKTLKKCRLIWHFFTNWAITHFDHDGRKRSQSSVF